MSELPAAGVLRVVGREGAGAGFLASDSGLIVTCAHVLAGSVPGETVWVEPHGRLGPLSATVALLQDPPDGFFLLRWSRVFCKFRGITSIIARPAASAGIAIERNLAERIAADTAQVTPSPGAAGAGAPVTVLPLLSSALAELWERQQDGVLTHRMYEQMGGVLGWLDRWCDRSHEAARARLPDGQRSLTRRVLTALVRPGDAAAGIPPTRQRRTWSRSGALARPLTAPGSPPPSGSSPTSG